MLNHVDVEKLLAQYQRIGMPLDDIEEIRALINAKLTKLEKSKGVEPGMLTVPETPSAIRRASSQRMPAIRLDRDPDDDDDERNARADAIIDDLLKR